METNIDKTYIQPVIKVERIMVEGLLCQSPVTEDVQNSWGEW